VIWCFAFQNRWCRRPEDPGSPRPESVDGCSPRLDSTKSAADGRPLYTEGRAEIATSSALDSQEQAKSVREDLASSSSSCRSIDSAISWARTPKLPTRPHAVDAADFYPVWKASEREPRRRCDEMVRVLNWTERYLSACGKQPQQESGHPLEQQQQRAAQAHTRLLQSKPTKKEMSSDQRLRGWCKPQK
jgi:hypothetical protein